MPDNAMHAFAWENQSSPIRADLGMQNSTHPYGVWDHSALRHQPDAQIIYNMVGRDQISSAPRRFGYRRYRQCLELLGNQSIYSA